MKYGQQTHTLALVAFAVAVWAGPLDAQAEWWCGQDGSPLSEFVPDKPTVNRLKSGRTVDFRGACMRHDVCYTIKNNSKQFCDYEFHKEITSKCNREYRGGERTNCMEWANMFRSAVGSRLGERAYRQAQERR